MRIKRLHNAIGERHVNQLIAAYLGAFPEHQASGAPSRVRLVSLDGRRGRMAHSASAYRKACKE
jgi:hypothetical protein